MKRDDATGMGMIVETVARWLKGPILLFGIYIVLYGHISPGGGFGGGVIIACGFILVTLGAGGRIGESLFPRNAAGSLDSVGLLLFLAVGCLGTWLASAFFQNLAATSEAARFSLISGGSMPVLNIALGLKVSSALFLVFTVLAAMRVLETQLTAGGHETADDVTPAEGGES